MEFQTKKTSRNRKVVPKFVKTAKQKEAIKFLSRKATHNLLEGGSRSGKTAIFLYAMLVRGAKAPKSRHAIMRFRFNHAKTSIWHDSLPVIANQVFPEKLLHWNNSDFYLRLPNESEIWLGGLDEKSRVEKILGQEYSTIFLNEISQIPYESVKVAQTRLAQKNNLQLKMYYDQNPAMKSHWSYKVFHEHKEPDSNIELSNPEEYVYFKMNPWDNKENIGKGYIENILQQLSPRERKRFLDGEYGEDTVGALWTGDILNKGRVAKLPTDLERVFVGVDPAVTNKDTSDDTGIITVGSKGDDIYVFRDDTVKAPPLGWAQAVVRAYTEAQADKVVGEVNQGGDLVESNIRQVLSSISYIDVRATRGKYKRAEPVANLSEQGKLHIVGYLPELEMELVSWTPNSGDESPNRMDAMVWAVSKILEGKRNRAGVWGNH